MAEEALMVGLDPRYSQMGQRKVTALAASCAGDGDRDFLYAHCDDGTFWILELDMDRPWRQLPSIPQPGLEAVADA